MDDENVTYPDLGAQFLVNEKSVGKNVKKIKKIKKFREQRNV
jgi:hypothetical protein